MDLVALAMFAADVDDVFGTVLSISKQWGGQILRSFPMFSEIYLLNNEKYEIGGCFPVLLPHYYVRIYLLHFRPQYEVDRGIWGLRFRKLLDKG